MTTWQAIQSYEFWLMMFQASADGKGGRSWNVRQETCFIYCCSASCAWKHCPFSVVYEPTNLGLPWVFIWASISDTSFLSLLCRRLWVLGLAKASLIALPARLWPWVATWVASWSLCHSFRWQTEQVQAGGGRNWAGSSCRQPWDPTPEVGEEMFR
jgi:hypothetical protein